MKHFIAMAGLHGYLPQTCEVFGNKGDAVNYLVELHELPPFGRKAKELRKDSYTELDLHKDGNEYAEITVCECDHPEIHSDSL